MYASFLIIRTLILGIDVPGYASLMVTALFLGGIQLLTLGISDKVSSTSALSLFYTLL